MKYINLNLKISKSYLIGFGISLICTIIPFLVAYYHIEHNISVIILIVCAVLQIFTHLIYFLHLNISTKQKWSNIFFLFTLIVSVILVSGSIWIILNLNCNLVNQ